MPKRHNSKPQQTMKHTLIITILAILMAFTPNAGAQVPRVLNYQGRVASGGALFEGTGQFKFALVNADGTTFYWRNDGGSGAGEPTSTVALNVIKGLFSARLGDTSFPNMAAIPEAVFQNTDLRLRVWFNDGVKGSQLLTLDSQISAAALAIAAGTKVTKLHNVIVPTFTIWNGQWMVGGGQIGRAHV